VDGIEGPAADRQLAGHADRERAIQALKDAFVQERLTRDELDVRAGRALTARTCAELAVLTADIPAVTEPIPVRPPTAARTRLVQRRPVVWAVAGSGSCLAIAFGLLIFASYILDPSGFGQPHHPGGSLCGLAAFVALLTGLGVFIHGMGTAEEQRRARKKLPSA
jgi:Domain of unknown function (DUF1707)